MLVYVWSIPFEHIDVAANLVLTKPSAAHTPYQSLKVGALPLIASQIQLHGGHWDESPSFAYIARCTTMIDYTPLQCLSLHRQLV